MLASCVYVAQAMILAGLVNVVYGITLEGFIANLMCCGTTDDIGVVCATVTRHTVACLINALWHSGGVYSISD